MQIAQRVFNVAVFFTMLIAIFVCIGYAMTNPNDTTEGIAFGTFLFGGAIVCFHLAYINSEWN